MNSAAEFAELALRRRLLLLRSAALRGSLAEQSKDFEAPFAAIERVQSGLRWLYDQRGLLTLGAVAVLVVRPRRALRLARFGWWAWRTARRALPWLVAAGFVMPSGTTAPRAASREGSPRA